MNATTLRAFHDANPDARPMFDIHIIELIEIHCRESLIDHPEWTNDELAVEIVNYACREYRAEKGFEYVLN